MNRNLYLVFGGIFCVWATQTVAFVLIPLIAADLGLSGVLIGVLVATPAGLGFATDILVAAISDRVGRRGPMVVGTLFGIFAGAFLALGSSFATLLGGALAFGISMSLSVGPALAYVTEACLPRNGARVQGYNGAVQGLSALASAVVVGFAVEEYGAPRSAWIISLLMATSLSLFVLLSERLTQNTTRWSGKELARSYTAALRMLIGRPQLQLASLVALVYSSVVFVLGNAFLPIYIVRDLKQSAVLVGVLLATRNIAMTFSSPFFGYTFGRFGVVRAVVGAASLATLGLLGMAFVTDPRFLFVPMALQGLGVGFTAAASNTLVTAATGRRERALGFAATSLVFRGGSIVSPLLFGAILETWGIQPVFVAGGVLAIAYLSAMIARARAGHDGESTHEWVRQTRTEESDVFGEGRRRH